MPLKKNADGSFAAPLPADESERLRELRDFQVLDTLPEQVYDDIVFLASHICQTPIALISLIDQDRQWFKARVGLEAPQTSRDMAFCAHAILQPEQVMQVQDATKDERFNTNPLVTAGPQIRFYAGMPLTTPDGRALGTLCAIDRKPRELDATQMRALRVLSREVMTQLELRRTILTLQRSLAASERTAATEAASQRARTLVTKVGEPGTEVEDRMRGLLERMQKLQRRTSAP